MIEDPKAPQAAVDLEAEDAWTLLVRGHDLAAVAEALGCDERQVIAGIEQRASHRLDSAVKNLVVYDRLERCVSKVMAQAEAGSIRAIDQILESTAQQIQILSDLITAREGASTDKRAPRTTPPREEAVEGRERSGATLWRYLVDGWPLPKIAALLGVDVATVTTLAHAEARSRPGPSLLITAECLTDRLALVSQVLSSKPSNSQAARMFR